MMLEKEIRSKIFSVEKTKKITKAMEMVAVSKMRKSQDRMESSRPYAEKIRKLMENMILGNIEYNHPYLNNKNVKKVGYLVVSTDRGLCGGLNINLFKKLLSSLKKCSENKIEYNLALIGIKAVSFFSSRGSNIFAKATGIGDTPSFEEIIGLVKVMLETYEKESLDALYIASNKFINTMYQKPKIIKILPLVSEKKLELRKKYWDYLYEQDNSLIMDNLLRSYVESQIYQCVIENKSSELAARMVAMKAATKNGGRLKKKLSLEYNKARQKSITQELTEIISGASMV